MPPDISFLNFREVEVGGSNPLTPTKQFNEIGRFQSGLFRLRENEVKNRGAADAF